MKNNLKIFYDIIGANDLQLKYFKYLKKEYLYKYNINSLHNVGCGNGYLVHLFSNIGIHSIGSDIEETITTDNEFYLFNFVEGIFPLKTDLIIINDTVINHLNGYRELYIFFKNIYNSLNHNGIIIFDYLTEDYIDILGDKNDKINGYDLFHKEKIIGLNRFSEEVLLKKNNKVIFSNINKLFLFDNKKLIFILILIGFKFQEELSISNIHQRHLIFKK